MKSDRSVCVMSCPLYQTQQSHLLVFVNSCDCRPSVGVNIGVAAEVNIPLLKLAMESTRVSPDNVIKSSTLESVVVKNPLVFQDFQYRVKVVGASNLPLTGEICVD